MNEEVRVKKRSSMVVERVLAATQYVEGEHAANESRCIEEFVVVILVGFGC
jgi:hypothetical protein